MSIRKRLRIVLLVCLVLVLSAAQPVMAAGLNPEKGDAGIVGQYETGIGVMPMMLYISRVTTNIYIGTYGETTVTGSITGYQGVTDAVWIFLYLEKNINGTWTTIHSWDQYFPSYRGVLQGTTVVPHGYYYRVRGSYYAYSGDDIEHVNGYSSTVYY